MPVLKVHEKKNAWETICSEFERKKTIEKKNDEINEFDPSKHSPIFYGYSYEMVKLDDEKLLDIDQTVSHPACFGYSIQPYLPKNETKSIKESKEDYNNTLSEKEYIENLVFPTLLPALEKMLAEAKLYKCFERKRTAFNACDFITHYIYKNNPFKSNDEFQKRKLMTLWDIPFVKDWIVDNPRPSLPKSLIWTEQEAAIKIQSFFRGYLVRRDPEVQELRKWQRELREENQNITQRVEKFWNDSSSLKKSLLIENTSSALFSSNSLIVNKGN